MCSVTFIPKPHGFIIGMNRDESRTRPLALGPRVFHHGARAAVHPSEPTGGTWIGVNDAGLCCALLNWYSIPADRARVGASRGNVLPALLAAAGPDEASALLARMLLSDVAPFRLVIAAPSGDGVRELRWDQSTLDELRHPWQTQHWFSSGHDEAGAQRTRSVAAQKAARDADRETLPWLRRLHASHAPARGPYCICMHRGDAATVSYTEVVVGAAAATLRYHGGPLCEMPLPLPELELPIVAPLAAAGHDAALPL